MSDSVTADWAVPSAARPVRALVRLPGSKSITNRALVLAALSDGDTEVVRPLKARDTRLMADGLRALGSEIAESGESWRISRGTDAGRSSTRVDVGNAGTVLRFLPAVAALTKLDVDFYGDERMSQRPVGPLLGALGELGARISGNGAVPFTVRGQGSVHGGSVTLDASQSSQLISGLLLAAPAFTTGAEVRHSGPPVPSLPHIEMTVRMLRARGVSLSSESGPASSWQIWRVFPGPISADPIFIEPDLSNALPFLAAALATGGEVTVADWPEDSLQAAGRIIDVLTAMGADVARTAEGDAAAKPERDRGEDARPDLT